MRAVVVAPDGSLQTVSKPDPEPGAGQVVVAVERCGICGSDLHLHGSGFIPPGAVMGHEFAGTVAAAGDGADIPLGARVAVLPSRRDYSCPRCAAGDTHLCPAQAATTIGLGFNDGAYAEYALAPATSCHLLPEGMTGQVGALVEPYAVALHAVRRALPLGTGTDTGAGAGQNRRIAAGVIGAGPIGLLTVAALKHEGVEHITVAERSETRAAVAAAMGATVTDDATRLAKTAGDELEVVFDAAGVPATTPIALEAVRPGGAIVLVGVVDIGVMIEMPGMLWVVKEVDVLPSIAYTDDEFAEAVRHLAEGAVDADLLVSDVRPLEGADQAFADLKQPGGPVKVQLAPAL